MRTINLIVVHCSATQGNRTFSPEENTVGTQSKLNYLKNEKGGNYGNEEISMGYDPEGGDRGSVGCGRRVGG